jgi:hypothetical protein
MLLPSYTGTAHSEGKFPFYPFFHFEKYKSKIVSLPCCLCVRVDFCAVRVLSKENKRLVKYAAIMELYFYDKN